MGTVLSCDGLPMQTFPRVTWSGRGQRFLLACMLVTASACSRARSPHKPFGVLPSASTKAVPQWLPERSTGGAAVEEDARETRLFSPRRLSTGWDVVQTGWSADGKTLYALTSAKADRGGTLFAVDPDGKVAPKSLSGEGERVLSFAVRRGEGSSRVVYAAKRDAASEPMLFEVRDGKTPAPVDLPGLAPQAVASGSGGDLLVVAADAGRTRIVRVPEKGDRSVLDLENAAPMAPEISPDRAYVVFAHRSEDASRADGLDFASVEGRGTAELVSARGASFRGLSFHPSGRLIAFAADRDRAAFELYAVELPATLAGAPRLSSRGDRDKAEARTVRLTFSQGEAPAFSPDGKSLAFASARLGPTRDLYVARFLEDP